MSESAVSTIAQGDLSYPPSRRLHYPYEYRRFRAIEPQVFRLRECTVFRVPNQLGHYRLGVTIKARMNSVRRNAIKRQIREAIRHLGPKLGSFDYNYVVTGARKLDYSYPRRLRVCLEKELGDALDSR
jgi:ribonuclease P protein component